MARPRRRTRSSLIDDLEGRPEAYDIFQAIRLVERIATLEWTRRGFAPPDPVGRGVDPKMAALRLRSTTELSFASAEVTKLRLAIGAPSELTQSVFGLVGTSGVLPAAFTEIVQTSVRERNLGLQDFLDLFGNRLAAFCYEAFAKYRLVIETERRPLTGQARIDELLRALIGLDQAAMAGRMDVPDVLLLHHAGLLGRHSRSVRAAEQTLSSGLGQPIRIAQFVGEWLPIAVGERTRLAGPGLPEGVFARLGRGAVVGTRTWTVQGRVRLLIGPLSYASFASYLPGGRSHRRLASLAAFTLGPDMAFSQRLELKAEAVPPFRLWTDRNRPEASRLGWNTWIASRGKRRAPGLVTLSPQSALQIAA